MFNWLATFGSQQAEIGGAIFDLILHNSIPGSVIHQMDENVIVCEFFFKKSLMHHFGTHQRNRLNQIWMELWKYKPVVVFSTTKFPCLRPLCLTTFYIFHASRIFSTVLLFAHSLLFTDPPTFLPSFHFPLWSLPSPSTNALPL